MMGSGKSSVGRKLAKALGRRFVDSDAEIERRYGRTVHEIFAKDGEDAFRRIEADVLTDLLTGQEPAVIATGGGAVVLPSNRDLMRRHGTVIWLRATPAVLAQRMSGASVARRPLIAELGGDPAALATRLAELSAQREVAYHQVAHDIVNVDGRPVAEIVDHLVRLVTSGERPVGPEAAR
jgi:shikimate kinase